MGTTSERRNWIIGNIPQAYLVVEGRVDNDEAGSRTLERIAALLPRSSALYQVPTFILNEDQGLYLCWCDNGEFAITQFLSGDFSEELDPAESIQEFFKNLATCYTEIIKKIEIAIAPTSLSLLRCVVRRTGKVQG